ncbi:hypothetical protein BM86_35655 [Bacillus thuringiensis]|uniref:Uncharacterized protein n=1 Tax=Bacillus thuringiensis TaxID=1428 RepID=A0A9W3X4L6_BACTU|nr:hypothetical protein [Bacillus thuringiensis]ANS52364.1 hypothetical protein BT246_70740 [Bacillus thuringiensis]MBH0340625.1 hypothetical protein [Bacillus thuringiensis]
MNLATTTNLHKFEFRYEIQKGLQDSSTGTCIFYAASEDIALRNAESEINRRFKGALDIVITPVENKKI